MSDWVAGEPDERVTIGTPLYGTVHVTCLASYAMLVARSIASGKCHAIAQSVGAYIDRARNTIVRQALNNDSTHLLFIDQDMQVPEDCLAYLLARDVPVVGGVYFGKAHPYPPVAFQLEPFERVTEYDSEGLTRVDGVGMGCTLIQTQVFKKMTEHYEDDQWFFIDHYVGEDVWFAQRCAELGIPIYLDGQVQCGHVGEAIYTEGHFLGAADYEITKAMVGA